MIIDKVFMSMVNDKVFMSMVSDKSIVFDEGFMTMSFMYIRGIIICRNVNMLTFNIQTLLMTCWHTEIVKEMLT